MLTRILRPEITERYLVSLQKALPPPHLRFHIAFHNLFTHIQGNRNVLRVSVQFSLTNQVTWETKLGLSAGDYVNDVRPEGPRLYEMELATPWLISCFRAPATVPPPPPQTAPQIVSQRTRVNPSSLNLLLSGYFIIAIGEKHNQKSKSPSCLTFYTRKPIIITLLF